MLTALFLRRVVTRRSLWFAAILSVSLLAGCALGTASRPTEAEAIDKLSEAEAVAESLAVDAFGTDAVGQWEREYVDDACTMTCSTCGYTKSELVLVGTYTLDQLMTSMADAAVSAAGSAEEPEEIGNTYRMSTYVNGDNAKHPIDVVLKGTAGVLRLNTGCYRTDS